MHEYRKATYESHEITFELDVILKLKVLNFKQL